MRTRLTLLLVALALVAAACGDGSDDSAASTRRAVPTSTTTEDDAGTSSTGVDTTRLPIGDGKYAAAAAVGSIFSCQQSFSGGGAFATGDWINGDGTFDVGKKPTVDGDVAWDGTVKITRESGSRLVTSNGVPAAHTTGVFPVSSSDDAFSFDRNPNRITTQSISVTLPAEPTVAAAPACLGMGPIGVMTTGVVVFNGLDAGGRDAVAHEIQDHCSGHPQPQGVYHYHSGSGCFTDPGTGHSALLGYALDGFGIYGSRGEGGTALGTADLDECHGHTHTVVWDGSSVSMYHYHLTPDYPYTLGCFRGTALQLAGIG